MASGNRGVCGKERLTPDQDDEFGKAYSKSVLAQRDYFSSRMRVHKQICRFREQITL